MNDSIPGAGNPPQRLRRAFGEACGIVAAWTGRLLSPTHETARGLALLPGIGGGRLIAAAGMATGVLLVLMLVIERPLMGWVWSLRFSVGVVFEQTKFLGKANWMLAGSVGICLALIAVSLLVSRRRRKVALVHAATMAMYVFGALALAGGTTALLKPLFGRERPNLNNMYDPLLFSPGSLDAYHQAMPSGDATNIAALAMALSLLFPRFWPILAAVAVWIAVGRVMVFSHFPSDVIVGCAIGAFGALLLARWSAQRKLVFAASPDGSLRLRGTRVLEDLWRRRAPGRADSRKAGPAR